MRQESGPTEKLQIPVSRALADALTALAKGMEWSQGHMAAKLLEVGVTDLKQVGNWLRRRAIGPGTERRAMGWLQQGDNSAVRLQVSVDAKLAEEITRLATRLNHTQVRMAALLLDFAVDEHRMLYRICGTRIAKIVTRLVGWQAEAYESAEVELDESKSGTEKG